MKAIGYARVSTNRQELSLGVQQDKIRAMAVVKDAELVEMIVDEDESGKSLSRPGAQKMLALIKARGADMVIIAKLDRLTRSLTDLAMLVELLNRKGVALVSVAETLDTGTASGRMVMNIMVTVGQWEREAIGERTSAVLQAKRARGERAGMVPYGKRVNPDGRRNPKGILLDLMDDEAEQAVIARIKGWREAGESLRAIAAALNAAGVKTRAGGEWKFQYVANVLEAK